MNQSIAAFEHDTSPKQLRDKSVPLANNTASPRSKVRSTRGLVLAFAPMLHGGGFYEPGAPGASFWDMIARAANVAPRAQIPGDWWTRS